APQTRFRFGKGSTRERRSGHAASEEGARPADRGNRAGARGGRDALRRRAGDAPRRPGWTAVVPAEHRPAPHRSLPAACSRRAGQTIIYSAAWEGDPIEIFSKTEPPESRALGFNGADLISVSSNGEVAIGLNYRLAGTYVGTGTLARVPLAAGAPRIVLDDVQ